VSPSCDLLVVGAGPCGIAVGAAAEEAGLDCVLFDKGAIASSLIDYPYYMTFFSTAVMLEVGGVPFTIPNPKPTRQEALAYYRRVVEHWGIDVRQYEAVESIFPVDGGFRIRTRAMAGEEKTRHARAVAVATGGFDRPNMLEVPGEDLPKVKHYYQEPYPFYDQDVAVIGGGNSAVEAALELYRNGARVTLVHFAEKIDRGVKPWVVPDITNRLDRQEIQPRFRTRVMEIRPRTIVLRNEVRGEIEELPNDWVLAMTGWRSDPRLLKELGVGIDPHSGIPKHDPETMETNVPDLFIAGVIAAGHNANKIFIENGREHGGRIVQALAGRLKRPAGRGA
jgi:thioredoxin reductase (NADPH)